MVKFVARGLSRLGGVYQVLSTRSQPDTLDFGGPIQLVHDVSRMAETQSAPGRFTGFESFQISTNAAVVESAVRGSLDPYSLFATNAVLNTDRSLVDIWLLDVSLLVHPNVTLVNAQLGARWSQAPLGGSEVVTTRLLGYFDAAPADVLVSGEWLVARPSFRPLMPMLLPDSSLTLRTVVRASGAVNAVLSSFHVWIGAKGALPPGVA